MMWDLSRTLPLVFLIVATVACGKKGPLLPPYVRQPEAAEVSAARRVGNDVYVTVAVPKADIDGATPASLAFIDVYAVTSSTPPPPGAAFLPLATLVTTIPVARAAEPGARSGNVAPDPTTGALQGTTVTIRETLTAQTLAAREPSTPRAPRPANPADDTATPQALRRFYMTVPRSGQKRVGLLSAVVDVPLTFLPDKVPAVRAAMSGRNVVLTWEASGGVIGWLLDRPLTPEVPLAAAPPVSTPGAAAPATPPTAGPTLYNIYRELAPDPLALVRSGAVASPWASTPAIPINAQPVAALTLSEDVPFDERRRCYQVRAVRGTGAQQVESEPSDRACLVPVDLEPPAAPTGLTATVVDGSVTLRWEPNGEDDLLGYVVLRRDAGDDTLLTLTRAPIADTRFTDSTLAPGRMYTYVIQAVDNRIPLPNVSDPTDTTVTAR